MIKYLEVMIDNRLVVLNIGEMECSRRLLVIVIVRSILLHAALVGESETLASASNKRRASWAYCSIALRVYSAFRAALKEILSISTAVISIDLANKTL